MRTINIRKRKAPPLISMQELADLPFVWIQQNGEPIPVTKMKTTHLFHCIKMIFNHLAPEPMKLKPYRRYSGIDRWSPTGTRWALIAMVKEIAKRPTEDLNNIQWFELEYIARTANQLSLLQVGNN